MNIIFPTTINGEFDAFRLASRDNIHNNNDESQSEDDDNDDGVEIKDGYDDDDDTHLSNKDYYDDDDDKIHDYFKVTESMKWVTSISRRLRRLQRYQELS